MMGVKPAACKLVLLCLADCHNSDNGRCDPGAGFICEFTGLDKKTVPESIRRLEQMGLITARKRPGNSTQYTLNMDAFPTPTREKGERKKALSIPKAGGQDPTRKRVYPKTGAPESGSTRKRVAGVPENGEGVYPKTGHEPTKNLPGTYQLPVPDGTAAVAAPPVDNFNLTDLARIYQSVDPESEIHSHGVPLLTRSGVEFGAARNFLKMLINKHGLGRTLDAVIVSLIENPVEPKSYLQAVAAKIGDEIPKDWVPPGPCLSEIAAMGIPDHVMREARDVFVVWFREMGIRHNNFPELFIRWCRRDWERAEANQALYRKRLQASAGFGEMFNEPA